VGPVWMVFFTSENPWLPATVSKRTRSAYSGGSGGQELPQGIKKKFEESLTTYGQSAKTEPPWTGSGLLPYLNFR